MERGSHGAAVILGVLNPTQQLRGLWASSSTSARKEASPAARSRLLLGFSSFSQLGGEPRGVLAKRHDAQHQPLAASRVAGGRSPKRRHVEPRSPALVVYAAAGPAEHVAHLYSKK